MHHPIIITRLNIRYSVVTNILFSLFYFLFFISSFYFLFYNGVMRFLFLIMVLVLQDFVLIDY